MRVRSKLPQNVDLCWAPEKLFQRDSLCKYLYSGDREIKRVRELSFELKLNIVRQIICTLRLPIKVAL